MNSKSRLITIKEIMSRHSISRSQVYRLLASGVLPSPIYVGPKSPRWDEKEVEEAFRVRQEKFINIGHAINKLTNCKNK